MSELRLAWCSHRAAAYACRSWHYSGTLPTPPLVKVGVWEDGRFVGAVVFSRGNGSRIGDPFGLDQTQVAELTRVALRDHRAPVSRIGSIAVRMLHHLSPGLRVLVSFADPARGHHGGIYQAMNWIYLGETSPTTEYVDMSGRRWHSRMVSPTGWKKVYGERRLVVRPQDCTVVRGPGKHKYAFPVDARMRDQLGPLALPYPKRADTAASVPVARS